jgi:hypothetical protein
MTRVIPYRFATAPAAPAATRLPAALRAIVARLETASRNHVAHNELCGLPEWQLLDIGLCRNDIGHPADTRLAFLRDSDRVGTSLLYVPRP